MRKVEINELKQIQLNIMDTISDFCEKNNINYWLEFGTLIGAVRHKGYIPWDDDIDIGMLREDYKKFSELFNSYNERYVLNDSFNNPDYNLFFGKVFDIKTIEKDPNLKCISHVNVDIFVFDEIPDDKKIQNRMFFKRNIYKKLSNLQMLDVFTNKILLRKLLQIILRIFPKNYFTKRFIKIISSYKNNSPFVGNFNGTVNYIFEKKLVEETIKVPFEDRFYRIPKGYDEILTKCYGNYMELPPVEKRINPHRNIEIYLLDE